MRELSLFSGAGGGLLGTKLLGWKHCGYVEYNEYCQKVIAQRIKDGILDDAPIFGDIRAFLNQGYADSYSGLVDVVTAGFPCQPWSSAATISRKNNQDLWPETFAVISAINPRSILLENVSKQAIERAGTDLHKLGYSTKGVSISAADLGADHVRRRYWLLAYPHHESKLSLTINAKMGELPKFCSGIWQSAPMEPGMDDGLANRMERFKAIGNGQVPAVVAAAWQILNTTKTAR